MDFNKYIFFLLLQLSLISSALADKFLCEETKRVTPPLSHEYDGVSRFWFIEFSVQDFIQNLNTPGREIPVRYHRPDLKNILDAAQAKATYYNKDTGWDKKVLDFRSFVEADPYLGSYNLELVLSEAILTGKNGIIRVEYQDKNRSANGHFFFQDLDCKLIDTFDNYNDHINNKELYITPEECCCSGCTLF